MDETSQTVCEICRHAYGVVIDCDGLGDGGIAPDVGQGGEFGVVV